MSKIASLPSHTTRRTSASGHRAGTISLELQSALKFALALALAIATVALAGQEPAAIAVLPLAAALGARGLAVISAGEGRTTVRPREHALWDGALAAALAATALVFVAAGVYSVGAVTGAAALALAVLRLRTRYVAG